MEKRLDKRILEARKKYNYHENYDIILATPWSEEETNGERFPLYKLITEDLEKMNKRVFLPHRDFEPWDFEFNLEVLTKILIPSSELVIAEVHSSPNVRKMTDTAISLETPLIYFYRKNATVPEKLKITSKPNNPIFAGICYGYYEESWPDLIKQIRESITMFYRD